MILKVDGVSKRIGNFKLDEMSFELPEGYIMGLVGTNGAGKTTLIHILMGLYHPDTGEVIIDGMNLKDNEKEVKDILGTVLLDEMFEPGFTLRKNAEFYGKYYSRYDADVFEKYLKRFGLDSSVNYKALSKGEKLKFSFAFALSHDPKLLILDEPTGNFDPEFRKEFFKVLGEFIEDGTKSVILATHLTSDLDRIADYITYLEKGKMVLSNDIEAIRSKYKLVSGESYKIKLLKEDVIYLEEREFGTKALVINHGYTRYDSSLTVTEPTVEELMYFITKRSMKKI